MIPAIKVGALCRFDVSDLADYLQRQREASFVRTPRHVSPASRPNQASAGEANVSGKLLEGEGAGPPTGPQLIQLPAARYLPPQQKRLRLRTVSA